MEQVDRQKEAARMNRKLAAILLVGLLLMCVQVASAKKYSLTFHTGAVGGLYMEPAAIWADQWHNNLSDVEVSVILGGGFTNPLVVADSAPNEAIGITDTLSAREVQLGAGEYAGRVPQGIKNLRALWRFNVKSWGHILARPGVVPRESRLSRVPGHEATHQAPSQDPGAAMKFRPAARSAMA